MVMPYAHLDRLAKVPRDAAHELMDLAQKTERVLDAVYRPQGFNFGLNLGEVRRASAWPGTCICMPCRAGSATPTL